MLLSPLKTTACGHKLLDSYIREKEEFCGSGTRLVSEDLVSVL